MAANAKPALEKIRPIQKPKTSAIQSNTSKFYKILFRATCRLVISKLELFSKAPKEAVHGPRHLEKRTVFADLPRQSFGWDASFGPNIVPQHSAQILNCHLQCLQRGPLHETKRIRTNRHER